MEIVNPTNQTSSDGLTNASQSKEYQSSVSDSSRDWATKSHAQKAAFLERVLVPPIIEELETASGTREGERLREATRIHRPSSVPSLSKDQERSTSEQTSEYYIRIMRSHYMKIILRSLRKVQLLAGSPAASVHINKILYTIRNFEEKSSDDPILEVLFALYDALAHQNLWTTYTAQQFEKAEQVLTRVLKESVNSSNMEKAIVALDNAGFITIPYQFSLEEGETP